MSKRNISYVQQDTPAFLKKFKEQVGYKEGPDINTKREELCRDDGSSDEDREDEKPQIVVLKKGDLTQEEVEEATKDFKINSDDLSNIVGETVDKHQEDSAPADGRIIFKKPDKNKQDDITKDNKSKPVKERSSKRKVKNTSLLSFGDDEEEDDDDDIS